MRARQRPARDDAVAFTDLLIDEEVQVGQQRQIDRDRFPGPGEPVVLERVDVIDELRVVHLADGFELAARADVFERTARGFGLAHLPRIADQVRGGAASQRARSRRTLTSW